MPRPRTSRSNKDFPLFFHRERGQPKKEMVNHCSCHFFSAKRATRLHLTCCA